VKAGELQRSYFLSAHPLLGPALAGDKGLGMGLDAQRVAAAGEGVRIHTGVAHRDGITGWIGIGAVSAPLGCFTQACEHLNTMRPAQLEGCV
jgi:hypothetical protein